MQKILELKKFGSSTEHNLDFDFGEVLSGMAASNTTPVDNFFLSNNGKIEKHTRKEKKAKKVYFVRQD